VELNVGATRLHVLLIHLHHASTTHVLHDPGVMRTARDGLVSVVISAAVRKATVVMVVVFTFQLRN